jgi:hypothetical protein
MKKLVEKIIGSIPAARFSTHYHPYVDALREALITRGLARLLSLQSQRKADADPALNVEARATFLREYQPTKYVYPFEYPKEIVDFDARGAYSQYNWELFFHAPFLIATRLSKNLRFEDAQKWFHFIFDPTTDSSDPAPKRYWKVKPFYDAGQGSSLQRLMKVLADKSDTSTEKADLVAQVLQWRENPFSPHAIARWRPRAYQLSVVMKYLDNLIAWGDQLFRRDTIESINEAAQIYILASEILGRRPERVPPRAAPQTQTFNSLEQQLDDFANALVAIEEFIAPSAPPGGSSSGTQQTLPLKMLYFCVPYNDKLLTYWDVVGDRLFKIRHCMNIEGVTRQLPLFEPPIDPGLLVKAAAAGVDLTSALNDINAALPNYRFNVLSQKASELCAEVKSVGASFLSALEKRDAEAMALLRSQHELHLLEAVRAVKGYQIEEAKASLDALIQSLGMARTRLNYYIKLLSTLETISIPQRSQQTQVDRLFTTFVDLTEALDHRIAPAKVLEQASLTVIQEVREALSAFDKMISGAVEQTGQEVEKVTLPMNRFEKRQLDELKLSNEKQLKAMDYEALAQILALIPDIKLGVPFTMGATLGGSLLSTAARVRGNAFNYEANEHSYRANLHSILGGYQRRFDEWLHQSELILSEITQIGKQMYAASMRLAIATLELKNHEQQIQNAREVDDFMQDKYTNQELYDWMVGQLSSIYFQSYQLAYDVAKRAERAYRFELGLQDSNFIQFGYWDSLKKGLLAGERLYHDLKRMEVAYLDQNKREYEITRHISLLLHDPITLITLKETGQCEVELPEALFDVDYPGHYMRRLKSVSLTIPCVVGPYTSINCTLTLLSSKTRIESKASNAETYAAQQEGQVISNFGAIQSIATSHAQNDSGLFELNFRDERYLPFEGAGAVSRWRIELTQDKELRQFDYDTISDVVLHLKYTARDGGGMLRASATDALKTLITESENVPLGRFFSAQHEFSSEWHRFLKPLESESNHVLRLDLIRERFPFPFRGRQLTLKEMELFLKFRGGVLHLSGELLKAFVRSPDTDATTQTESLPSSVFSSLPNQYAGLPHISGITLDKNLFGKWQIEVQKAHVQALLPSLKRIVSGSNTAEQPLKELVDALEDIYVVCHYAIGDVVG